MKDVRDIVQTTTHIAEIVIIYLNSLLEKQSKENISVENVGQPYMVDIITALLVHRKRDLSKTVIGGIGEKMNNTEKLLPCPFCGEKAKLHSTKGLERKGR